MPCVEPQESIRPPADWSRVAILHLKSYHLLIEVTGCSRACSQPLPCVIYHVQGGRSESSCPAGSQTCRKVLRKAQKSPKYVSVCRVQSYPFAPDHEVLETDGEMEQRETASAVVSQQTPQRLLEVHGRLCELLAPCIPSEIIMKGLSRNFCITVMDSWREKWPRWQLTMNIAYSWVVKPFITWKVLWPNSWHYIRSSWRMD